MVRVLPSAARRTLAGMRVTFNTPRGAGHAGSPLGLARSRQETRREGTRDSGCGGFRRRAMRGVAPSATPLTASSQFSREDSEWPRRRQPRRRPRRRRRRRARSSPSRPGGACKTRPAAAALGLRRERAVRSVFRVGRLCFCRESRRFRPRSPVGLAWKCLRLAEPSPRRRAPARLAARSGRCGPPAARPLSCSVPRPVDNADGQFAPRS